MMNASLLSVVVLVSQFAIGLSSSLAGQEQRCRCYIGDACWPSASTWEDFSRTLGDEALLRTSPLAAPCHIDGFASYNAAECKKLQDGWLQPETHFQDSSSIMAPFFANRSCDPYLPRSSQCVIGTYIQYAVNVTKPEQISKTIKFAQTHNIRLVIRNTAHDYNGKSTGSGALGIWTHHMKDIDIIDYKDKNYQGKAIKMGAGVQGIEAYQAAHAHGLTVVGGECPTVGIAGGYTQGGGHSALASKYGLAADQTLEMEVITGTGQRVIANRRQNSDLYWALSGGGGGTYGVVTSMTVKAHKDIPVSAANLTFTSDGMTQDQYYKAIEIYHAALPAIVDIGAMSVWYFTNESFAISPLTGPGVTGEKLTSLLQPLTSYLDSIHVNYTGVTREFRTYLDEYKAMQSPIEVGIAQYGGRLIPRSLVQNNNAALTAAYRNITSHGAQFIGVGINVSSDVVGKDKFNAVHPAWRDTLIDTVITTPWNFTAPLEDMLADQRRMTEEFIPQLAALTPDGACYLNEGDFRQPDWQRVFYGENYEALLRIKDKYDPHQMFYAVTAVGSDRWRAENDGMGRLCRVD